MVQNDCETHLWVMEDILRVILPLQLLQYRVIRPPICFLRIRQTWIHVSCVHPETSLRHTVLNDLVDVIQEILRLLRDLRETKCVCPNVEQRVPVTVGRCGGGHIINRTGFKVEYGSPSNSPFIAVVEFVEDFLDCVGGHEGIVSGRETFGVEW